MKKEFSVQWIDSYGSARKIQDSVKSKDGSYCNWHTAKFTLEEAREVALEMKEKTGRPTKVCKGWTVVEIF